MKYIDERKVGFRLKDVKRTELFSYQSKEFKAVRTNGTRTVLYLRIADSTLFDQEDFASGLNSPVVIEGRVPEREYIKARDIPNGKWFVYDGYLWFKQMGEMRTFTQSRGDGADRKSEQLDLSTCEIIITQKDGQTVAVLRDREDS